MTASESTFLVTVAQIIPVILLAMAVEARLFKYTELDAKAGVKEARAQLRSRMPWWLYWLWRAYASYRRLGVDTTVGIALAFALTWYEFAVLDALARDEMLAESQDSVVIVVIAITVLRVGVAPIFQHLTSESARLDELQDGIRTRMQEEEEARRRAEAEQTPALALASRGFLRRLFRL